MRDLTCFSASPEYRAWQRMKRRCNATRGHAFKYYGSKGIKVFDGWIKDAQAFIDHIGKRPSVLHSVDRIRNEEGYFPGNVRWATKTEQLRNRSGVKLIDVDYVLIQHWISRGFRSVDIATAFGVTRRRISGLKRALLASEGATGVT